jgi:hypothetical protein
MEKEAVIKAVLAEVERQYRLILDMHPGATLEYLQGDAILVHVTKPDGSKFTIFTKTLAMGAI